MVSTLEQTQVQKGQDQVSGGVSVLFYFTFDDFYVVLETMTYIKVNYECMLCSNVMKAQMWT